MINLSGCFEEDLTLENGWLDYNRPITVENIGVFWAHLGTTDILNRINDSTTLIVDSTGLIIAKYSKPILAEWYDVAKINNLSLNIVHDITPPSAKAVVPASFNFEERIKINALPDQRYDSILLNDATLIVNVDWPEGIVGTYTVTFPDIVKDGSPLIYTVTEASDLNASDRLPNYWIYPQQSVDSSYIRILINATVNSVTGVPTSTKLTAVVSFETLTPETIWGYFGTTTAIDKDFSMDFPFFESYGLADEDIEFTGMYVNVNVDNYTGTPYGVTISNAIFSRVSTDETVTLTFLGNNTIHIDQAEYSDPIVPKNNFTVIDTSNSNIRDAFNLFPDKFDYHMTIISNPNGENKQNFLRRNNKVDGIVEMYIPFWFRINDLFRYDTINFDINGILQDSANANYVDTMKLMFEFENGFPFELNTQGYLVDSANKVVGTLFDSQQDIWVSGKLNANDRVVEHTLNKVDLIFDKEKVKNYSKNNVTKIILFTQATTSDTGKKYVKLYEDYTIDIRFRFTLISNYHK